MPTSWTIRNYFVDRFGSREDLKSHFLALKNYRNPLGHNRQMDPIDQKSFGRSLNPHFELHRTQPAGPDLFRVYNDHRPDNRAAHGASQPETGVEPCTNEPPATAGSRIDDRLFRRLQTGTKVSDHSSERYGCVAGNRHRPSSDLTAGV